MIKGSKVKKVQLWGCTQKLTKLDLYLYVINANCMYMYILSSDVLTKFNYQVHEVRGQRSSRGQLGSLLKHSKEKNVFFSSIQWC